MNDSSSEEKNASLLSEEVRQQIMRSLKAFLRGREVDLDELEKCFMFQYDKKNRFVTYPPQHHNSWLKLTTFLDWPTSKGGSLHRVSTWTNGTRSDASSSGFRQTPKAQSHRPRTTYRVPDPRTCSRVEANGEVYRKEHILDGSSRY